MSCSWHGETPRDKGEKLPLIVKEKPQCFGPEHETWTKKSSWFLISLWLYTMYSNLGTPQFSRCSYRKWHGARGSLTQSGRPILSDSSTLSFRTPGLLNWVGWKNDKNIPPKGGNKWWFTMVEFVIHQISLGTKISHAEDSLQKSSLSL